ncbi:MULTISPECIES: DUF4303 domain-containing protein [Pseudoalteromonas]|jgi:hypothetical protein|uniref:DUF4303 domain-containing protein n=1 Tax=Pseudoalteromonas TaxID=53246 RepID=UPI0021492B63|nr:MULTISPECIES: DUF4303 domain-containing protein [Pseudoalteromonas]
MDMPLLREKIESAIKDCCLELKANHGQSNFYSFALYSDPDAASIAPSANTKDYLNELVSADPSDTIYYKWSPGEWQFEGVGAKHFNEISKELFLLSSKANSVSEKSNHRNIIFNSIIEALANVKQSGFFDSFAQNPIIVFSVIGNEDIKEEVRWISELNRIEEAEEFEQWIYTL